MYVWVGVCAVAGAKSKAWPACCAGQELSPVSDADIKQKTWGNSVLLALGKDAEERASGCLLWGVFPVREGLWKPDSSGKF